MNKTGIVFDNLIVKINNFTLNNVNLKQEKGTILGIVGRNGAGKTTLIKTLVGLNEVYDGDILIDGISRYNDEEAYLKQLGVVSDRGMFNIFLKPKKIKKLMGKTYSNFDEEFFINHLENQNIDLNKRLSKMSLGEIRKVNIIAVMSLDPNILILDEPLANVDPISKAEITQLLQKYLTEEKLIIYSTNQTDELDKIADYLLLLEKGNVLLSGEKDNIISTNYIVTLNQKEFDLIKDSLISFKDNGMNYTGLTLNKELIDKYNLSYKMPNIEELMYYYIVGEKV